MKRYLVTGSSGFLGSHVVDYLVKEKNKVTCIDIKKSKFQNPKAKYIFDDLNKLEILNKYLKNIDIVVHLAAMADINKTKKHRIDAINQNIVLTAKILESMKKNNVKKIIFSSSIYAYSRTGSIYKITKQTSESLIKEYKNIFNFEYTIIRFGTLYGSRSNKENAIFNYIYQAYKDGKINVRGDGSEVREYLNILDAAKFLANIRNNYKNETLLITGNNRYTLKELIEIINEIVGGKIKIKYGSSKDAHYKHTPYSFIVDKEKKISFNEYRDLGQGIIDILEEINKEESK